VCGNLTSPGAETQVPNSTVLTRPNRKPFRPWYGQPLRSAQCGGPGCDRRHFAASAETTNSSRSAKSWGVSPASISSGMGERPWLSSLAMVLRGTTLSSP